MPHRGWNRQWEHVTVPRLRAANYQSRPGRSARLHRGRSAAVGSFQHQRVPDQTAGGVPRSDRFNTNVFQISTDPRMPAIDMTCQTVGFVPSNDTPIYWRLQIRHVLCRHQPQGNYRYIGACEVLTDEWQGKSRAAVFQLFRTPAAPQPAAQPAAGQPATGQPAAPAADPDVDYDYNTNDVGGPVMGGNAILTVAAKPPGYGVTLLDYVHLRIIAAANPNPGQADVLQFLGNKLSGRDPNIDHMVT